MDPTRTSPTPHPVTIVAWLSIVGLVAVTAFFAHAWSERMGYIRLADVAVHQLSLHAAGLDSELGKYESLPSMVELEPDLLPLLSGPIDTRLQDKVNRQLLKLNVRAGSLSIFVMNAHGTVLAASNWYAPDTPVGKDLSFASYHVEALRSGQAVSFVADATRGAPECYFTRAIVRQDRTIGVTAVRISLEPIETSWIEFTAASQNEKLLVIDDNDVVIMSSNPEWKNKTVAPFAPPRRNAPAPSSKPLANAKLPLGLVVKRPLPYGPHLVSLPVSGAESKAEFLAEEKYMARPGWRLMTLPAGRAPCAPS